MDDKEKLYCVYKHTSPSDKVYIGITSLRLNDRWQNGLGYKTNQYFWRAIQKYGWDNFKHEVLFNNLTKDEAIEKEVELIKLYDSTNPKNGYNRSTGGDGPIGVVFSEETRNKIRESKLGDKNPNYGKHPSDETCEKLRRANSFVYMSEEQIQERKRALQNRPPNDGCSKRGVKLSEESRRRISESKKGNKNPNYGKHLSDECKSKIRQAIGKTVIQLDEENNFIKVYSSITEAAKQTGYSASSICLCCKGRLGHAGGFKWMYESEYKDLNCN